VIKDFQRRLVKLENEIALIRSGFNSAVERYRTRRETIPDHLLAKCFGFKPKSQLVYSEAAHNIPKALL